MPLNIMMDNNNNNNNNKMTNHNNNNNSSIVEDEEQYYQQQHSQQQHSQIQQIQELPTNVSTVEQLELLPIECCSGYKDRPLRHVDEDGYSVYMYSLNPLLYAGIYILLIEALERFSFYGLNYTLTSYLTGVYNTSWNAGMDSISASSYVSISVAVAYTTPFVGAILADVIVGEYYSILIGCCFFYFPGLLLIACTTIPNLLVWNHNNNDNSNNDYHVNNNNNNNNEFNRTALSIGILFLLPVGTGIVKSIVNVFGAKQYHPFLQTSLIETFYVQFYMSINIGALVGGIIVPLLAQYHITIAYFIPVIVLFLGIIVFICGTSKYVCTKPKGSAAFLFLLNNYNAKSSKNNISSSSIITKTANRNGINTAPIGMNVICMVSLLTVPFNIAYSQMATTFIVQGTVMHNAFGFIDAATMNNADAISVLCCGYIVGTMFYPTLSQQYNIKISTTYKFAIGTFMGTLGIAWALYVEYMIHYTYNTTGQTISILWQSISYICIGCGEIFAVSAVYEAVYNIASAEQKVMASAINLFCVGTMPNIFCIILYNWCKPWFTNTRDYTTHISNIDDYVTANVRQYFWLLLIISLLGVIINILPPIKEWVESIEDRAVDLLLRTPRTPTPLRKPPSKQQRLIYDHNNNDDDDDDDTTMAAIVKNKKKKMNNSNNDDDDDLTPLMKMKRHQDYLKYGSGPLLYKSGSMRAGAATTAATVTKQKKNNNNSNNKKNSVTDPAAAAAVERDQRRRSDSSIISNKKRASISRHQITKIYRNQLSTTSTSSSNNTTTTSTTVVVVSSMSGKPKRLGSLLPETMIEHQQQQQQYQNRNDYASNDHDHDHDNNDNNDIERNQQQQQQYRRIQRTRSNSFG